MGVFCYYDFSTPKIDRNVGHLENYEVTIPSRKDFTRLVYLFFLGAYYTIHPTDHQPGWKSSFL